MPIVNYRQVHGAHGNDVWQGEGPVGHDSPMEVGVEYPYRDDQQVHRDEV